MYVFQLRLLKYYIKLTIIFTEKVLKLVTASLTV